MTTIRRRHVAVDRLEGVGRVARAFERLGDRAVAVQCACIARRLAERGGARPG